MKELLKEILLPIVKTSVALDELVYNFEELWDFVEYNCKDYDRIEQQFVNIDIELRRLPTEMESTSRYLELKDSESRS